MDYGATAVLDLLLFDLLLLFIMIEVVKSSEKL